MTAVPPVDAPSAQPQADVVPGSRRPHPIQVVSGSLRRGGRWRILTFVAAALISFLAVSQLSGPDQFREQLSNENEGDLARILASLSTESNALQEELAALKVQLATVQDSSAEQGSAAAQTSRQLDALRVLAGTVPVIGPGLQLVIDDPETQVTYDVLVDAVQELRDAGAEALAINGRRVGVSSSFGSRDGKVTLDGVVLPTPYAIDAIGPAATMEGGVKIPGGTLDTLRALTAVKVDVQRSNSLTMPAVEQPPAFRSARPLE